MTKIHTLAQKARACLARDLAHDLGSPWSVALQLAHLGLAVVSYFFLAAQLRADDLGGYAPFGFLLVGITVQGYMTTVLVAAAQVIDAHRTAGTLKAVLSTRTAPLEFVLLSSLYPLCRATVDIVVFLAVGAMLGWSPRGSNLLAAAGVVTLSLGAFASLGLMLAAVSLFSNRAHAAVTAVVTGSWLLSGGLYPATVLPAWLQVLAPALPATHAIAGLRAALLHDAPLADVGSPAAALALFTLVALPAGALAFTAGLRRATVYGTLAHA